MIIAIDHGYYAIKTKHFDLKAMPVVILGGGASVIKRNLRPDDRLCRPICIEGDRVNAEGFERLLAQMSGSVSSQ